MRSKHSRRSRHGSHRESSEDDDRHKSRSRHDNSQHQQNLNDGENGGDTRRRSIHYEDDIERTTRQAERERDRQRWR